MDLLNCFTIFQNVHDDLKSVIKSYYVFNAFSETNALFVTIDNKVFGLGENENGFCGQGHDQPIKTPHLIPELCDKNVKEFFNGYDFVLCLTKDNHMFSWGRNDHGQLGIGCVKENRFYEPQLIEFPHAVKILQVCCGYGHSLVLTEEGVVYGWGNNRYGQMWFDKMVITSPKPLSIDQKVIKIHCSRYESFAITEKGRVYFFGIDNYEQAEEIKLMKNVKSIVTSNDNIYFSTEEGDIYFCGKVNDESVNSLLRVLNLKDPTFVSCSNFIFDYFNFIIIISQDEIYELINKNYRKTNYKKAEKHYCLNYGQTFKSVHIFHDNNSFNLASCQSITTNYTSNYLKYANKLEKFKISERIDENLKCIIKYFHIFKPRSVHNILFITVDDKAFGIGSNDWGVLGFGNMQKVTKPQIIPELCDQRVIEFRVGFNFVLALTSENKLYSWGANERGQLGIGHVTIHKTFKPTLIEYFIERVIMQISCGDGNSVVLTSDGRVHFWGSYQNVIDIVKPLELEFVPQIKSIHCSRYQILGVTDSGRVCYWGDNEIRQKVWIVELSNINFICSTNENTYFVTNDFKIIIRNNIFRGNDPHTLNGYFVDKKQSTSFQSDKSRTCALYVYGNLVNELNGDKCWETKYKTPFDYYCERFGITNETYQLDVSDQYKNCASNITNSLMVNFIIQENKLSNILKPFSITKRIGIPALHIKYFFIFEDNNGYNMFYMTDDDSVFGFGSNQFGCCGFGHNNEVFDPQLIKELCSKHIIKFINGLTFSIAHNNDNELFVCGKLSKHQVQYSRYIKIYKLESCVEDICCSEDQAIILTHDGLSYMWGTGKYDYKDNDDSLEPFKLEKLPQIKIIASSARQVFAVSHDDYLFSSSLNFENPMKLPDNILSICIDWNLFVLTSKKEILYRPSYNSNYKFIKINFPHNIEAIYSINSYILKGRSIISTTENGIYYIDQTGSIMKFEYKNSFEFFAEELQLTYNTIDPRIQSGINIKSWLITGTRQS